MSSDALNKIVEDLSKLTVSEAAKLSKLLEEKWGVEANAPVAVVAAPGAGGEADCLLLPWSSNSRPFSSGLGLGRCAGHHLALPPSRA